MKSNPIASFDAKITRLGVVLEANGDPLEIEGVLNPAVVRDRDGKLVMYPRAVAAGNQSRVAIAVAEESSDSLSFKRAGYALEPETPYEKRSEPGGFGCEDPRVTFIPALDLYVMAYTAYGSEGPRIAVATSRDAYAWQRLGLLDFSARGLPCGDDKDGAFFPEPVYSPRGVLSFALYHRPMLHISAVNGCAAVPIILDLPPADRESTRIAYIPVEPVLADVTNLLNVSESALVLEPAQGWGALKNGAGTPPLRIEEGWLSFFHAVDGRYGEDGACIGMWYSGGIVVHDLQRPDIVRYRSPKPVIWPQTDDETRGVVNYVVFPTGIDVPPGAPARTFDVYYGMADARIGRFRAELATLGEEASAQ
ncbi:MAG: glycosidase, partial [Candidatus Eremiobacteraeota bacterium]|nr:glycosidase [Candidatus Eremiobacteraeota bacterium]